MNERICPFNLCSMHVLSRRIMMKGRQSGKRRDVVFTKVEIENAAKDMVENSLEEVFSGSDYCDATPIWPIGLAALRRPGEQRGFGMEMTERNKDMNCYYGVRLFRFCHSEEASLKIWDQTMGGGIFFPYDPMTEKVRNMRKYRIYSEEAFQIAYKIEEPNLPIDNARNALVDAGCTFVDKLPFAYTDKEIVYINELFRQMYPGNFEVNE